MNALASIGLILTLQPSALRVDWVRSATTAASCPTGGTFERALRDRLPEPPSGTVEAWVYPSADGFAASLRVRREAAPAVQREVEAPDCDRLVDTAAVVAAVLLDPWAEPEAAPEIPEEAPRPRLGRLDFATGVQGQAGTLPSASVGPRLAGRWHPGGPWVVSLGLVHMPEVRQDAYGFTLTSGYLGAGAQLSSGPWELGLEAGGHIGSMTAVVFPDATLTPDNPGSTPWVGVSMSLRAAWVWADRFGLELTGGPLLAVTRQRFDVRAETEPAFQEDIVAGRLGLSLFVLFRE